MKAADPGRVVERIFPGDGEMARRMREYPWRDSPLGDPALWPQSLRTAVHICLTSRLPIVLWWGRELRLLYNDAWRPVLGRTKHPAALGAPGCEVWPEIWHIIGPMFQRVLDKGEATWSDDQLLPVDRNGYLEEAYFTYSYSPIPDERGQVGGVFAAVNETTLKVVAERRLRTLRELAAQTLQAKGAVEAARRAIQTLAANRSDVPFALLYLVDADGRARLEQFSPEEVAATDGRWPIAEALERGEPILLERLVERFGALPSPWPSAPEHALVLPLKSAAQGRVLAVLVVGVNPARELDEEHRGFLDMAARHIAASVSNASAYEEERRSAEALAELDRAKTAFFSNVSHEFRTPLTLGPLEDMLAKSARETTAENRAALEVMHRCEALLRSQRGLEESLARASQLGALYRLTDRLQRAGSEAEIHEAALDAIVGATRCARASILLFDQREVMRFVAWRHLSEEYRRAVEGHSPWRADEKEAKPITIEDVERADLPAELKASVRREGIRALAFIPLYGPGRLIGKFMLYHDHAHQFAAEELDLAVAIGTHVALGLQRARAEATLRESEQQLRLALEAGRMGAWEWDIKTNRVSWSPGLEALHGLAPGTFEGTFEAFQRDILPEDREKVERRISHTLASGEEHHIEYRIAPAGGSTKWVEGRGKLFRDADGRPQRMVGVCIEVTERKLAEERLRRSEQALNDFFESASVGLHWVGPNGIILRANRAELDLLGYAKEEYIGRHIADFHVERAVIDDILTRLKRGERLHEYPAQMRCKDGSVRDVLITSSVLFENGKFIHTRCFTVDVTARTRAEKALLARAEQQKAVAVLGELALRERDLQNLFEQATETVARTLEIEYCKVLELLPGGTEVLLRAGVGWKPGLVGVARVSTGVDSQAGYTLSSDGPVVVQDLRTEPRFRGPPLLSEHGVVSGMSCVIRGPDGSAWGVLGTHSVRRIEFTKDDVSFLTSVANVLGHAIQRERADAALRESDRRKDEFIAMLSHELRNPLAPLRSALDLMRLKAPAGTDGHLRAMMERQVGQLVRLVDDLLETSRISRGLLELKREPLELAPVLRNAVESAEPLVREAEHRLEVDLPHEPLWVEGDSVRLAQTFANLLNNAARYTPRGGSIWLRAAASDGKIRISVRDSGVGLSLERKKRLFEMFARGEGSSGLGIGLALARRLVEMHGGTIEARSDGEGRGAEFVVTLPLGAAPDRPARPSEVRSSNGFRVLVADDNRDAAESLAALLRVLGNDVSIAYDGVEAVEAARTQAPDVILLDIGMPRLDGYGAAREIRRDPQARRIKIVALTGWGQEEDRRRAQEAGFDAHLVKPAELDALRRVLAEVNKEIWH